MTDRIPDSSTENCTAALAHLAFCALVALAFARRDGVAGTPGADNLGLHAETPENSVTKAKDHPICITLNKLRVM